jgi:uncharacterized protein
MLLALTAAIAPPPAAPADPPRVLIVTGVNNHDWRKTTPRLKEILEKGGFAVDVSEDPNAAMLDDSEGLKKYKALILNFNTNKRWTAQRDANFLKFVKDGGGLVVVHGADNAFDGWDEYDKLVGGAWRKNGSSFPDRGTFHPAHGPFEVQIVDDKHPITKGLGATFTTTDEKYSNLKLQDNIHVLAQAMQDGKPQPLLFVSRYGSGRMFQTALGHDVKAMETPQFGETLVRGARWASALVE